MIKTLNPAMVGMDLPFSELCALAGKTGFQGVEPNLAQAFPRLGGAELESALAALKSNRLVCASAAFLPGRLNGTEEEWTKGMEGLEAKVAFAAALGVARATIVMLPFNDALEFGPCFDLCVSRLRSLDDALAPKGIRIGVEYVAQITRRSVSAKPFIYSLDGTLALLHAVGRPGVGLLLDSFHWHCAGETVRDLEALRADQVVVAHIADAPDRPMAEQVAFERKMLGEGTADLKGFLAALRRIGYDGPLVCEPFQESFKTMDSAVVADRVSVSLDAVLAS